MVWSHGVQNCIRSPHGPLVSRTLWSAESGEPCGLWLSYEASSGTIYSLYVWFGVTCTIRNLGKLE